MKLSKVFLGMIGMVAFVLASCSENDEYEWATVSGPQVYFSNELPDKVEISLDASTFNVPLCRVDASSALTVDLTTSIGNPMYSMPSSVSFNAGETTVMIPVAYDPGKIEYGRYDTISINVKDDVQTSSWGTAEYKFAVGKTAWVKMEGKATYREDLVTSTWSVDNLVYEVDIEKNIVQEGLYRLVNPYGEIYKYNEPGDWDATKDYYLVVDASDPDYVHVPKSELGVNWGYGWWYTIGLADNLAANGDDIESLKTSKPGIFGKFVDGVITMPAEAVLFNYGGGERTANGSGLFAIALPGFAIADYASTIDHVGIFTNLKNEAFAVANVTLGPDATTVKAVVVEADADATAVADAIAAGDLEAVEIEDGDNHIPIPADLSGRLQIVLVVLTDDKVQYVTSTVFEYYGGASPWKSIGAGFYTDDFIVPFYGKKDDEGVFHPYDPYTYQVEIEENTETPGLYRLKNLYAGVAKAFGEKGGEKDIVIHAENPNGVYFVRQATGLDLGDGEFEIESEGGYYVDYLSSKGSSVEEIISKNPEVFGTLKDGTITLPTLPIKDKDGNPTYDKDGNPKIYQGSLYLGSSGYYACTNGAFKLVFPTAPASVKAKAKSLAKASDFERRLSGGSFGKYKRSASLPRQVLKKMIKVTF